MLLQLGLGYYSWDYAITAGIMLLQLGLCYYSWDCAITTWVMLLQLGLCYYSVYDITSRLGYAIAAWSMILLTAWAMLLLSAPPYLPSRVSSNCTC